MVQKELENEVLEMLHALGADVSVSSDLKKIVEHNKDVPKIESLHEELEKLFA